MRELPHKTAVFYKPHDFTVGCLDSSSINAACQSCELGAHRIVEWFGDTDEPDVVAIDERFSVIGYFRDSQWHKSDGSMHISFLV